LLLGDNMQPPLSKPNIENDFELKSVYEAMLRKAEPDEIQKTVIELLKGKRNRDTLKAISELIPIKKFESYKSDALITRARWRRGRLETACKSVFDKEQFNVLEIGCGRGEMLAAIMENYEARCVGLDPVDSLFINNRKEVPELSNALMVKGVAEEIPFCEANFDLVLGYNSMEHFADPKQVVEESYRVLKPRGTMYFWFGPPFNGPYGPHLHHRFALPYLHHLFPEEVVAEYLGIDSDPYDGKNRWKTQSFRELFTQNPNFTCTYYLEEYVWDHLWLVRALPNDFSELSPSELVIRAIEVACVKNDTV